MSDRTSASHTFLNLFYRYPLLMQGLSWIGGLSMLSSGLVWAQTDPNPDTLGAPTIQKAPEPVRVESAPQRHAEPVFIHRSAPIKREQPVIRQRRFVAESESEPRVSRRARLAAPKLYVPPRPEIVTNRQPLADEQEVGNPKVIFKSSPSRETASAPVINNDKYIDSTDYSIGATRTYEPPNRVVFSQRNRGCRTEGICDNSAPRREIAQLRVPYTYTQRSLSSRRRSLVASSERGTRVNYTQMSSNRLGLRQRQTRWIGQKGNSATPLNYYASTINRLNPINSAINSNSILNFPLSIPAAITSTFGWRIHPITGNRRFHAGTDLGAPSGTPVVAAYAGQVAIADWMGGYGMTVVLKHSQSEETLYGHLSEILVQPGQQVKQGEMIGRVGSTGNSTGPHLHFELRELTSDGWVAKDPGAQLEYALAQLIQGLRNAQATPPSRG